MSNLKRMMGLLKKLRNGVGVQSLIDAASGILSNPIAMFNTEYKLIAYHKIETDDPLLQELYKTGTFCSATRKLFEAEGFVEEVANNRIALLKSEKLKYDRINGKVFNKNNSYVSNLMIVAANRPFEQGDEVVFDSICKLISKEISNCDFFQEYEQTHQEALITSIIDGDFDINQNVAQVEILYDNLGPNLYLVVTDLPQEENSAEHYRNLFMQVKPSYKYAIYHDHILVIASTYDKKLKVSKDLKDLINVFEQNNIYAGISSRFENLFELQKYYFEALKAMNYALERKSSCHIFPCCAGSMETMAKIEGLENGNGTQYLLDKGPEIFGNPVLFHDLELNLLGYTQDFEIIDPIWQELIAYGTGSDETINLFITEGFVNTMDSTKGGALLVSDKIKYDRISWRIYSKDNIMIGCISIVNTNAEFNEDLLILFGAFGQKFTVEVSKNEMLKNYGRLYSDTVINRLISGKIDDYIFYSENIGNLYDSILENVYLMVVDTTKSLPQCSTLTYFRDLFSFSGTVNRYAVYENNIIIIISSDFTLSGNEIIKKVSRAFEQNNIYAGLSSRFEDIYELQKYYREALDALKNGLEGLGSAKNGQHIFVSQKKEDEKI